jgi:hypothetical protein
MNTGYIRAMRQQVEAERARLATTNAPQAPNAPRRVSYPGKTPDDVIGGEIRAMLRAGYYETVHGTADALDTLRAFGLGTFTALRLWTDAVREYRGGVC